MEHWEVKTTMCEMKYTLHGIDSRLEIAEEKINELDTTVVETVHTEAEKKRIFLKWTEQQWVVEIIQTI